MPMNPTPRTGQPTRASFLETSTYIPLHPALIATKVSTCRSCVNGYYCDGSSATCYKDKQVGDACTANKEYVLGSILEWNACRVYFIVL
jgi:hypothetical protein